MPTDGIKTDRSTWSGVIDRGEWSPRLQYISRLCMAPLCLMLQCPVFCIGLNCPVAQSLPVVTGSILDSKTKMPVSNALVVLAGTLHGSLTGSDGDFKFSGISLGMYTLTVSAEGYAIFEQSVEVDGDMNLNILLVPEGYDLPDHNVYVNPQDGWSTNLFNGLLPSRVNAIHVQYALFESTLSAQSLYLDGIRLIDPFTPLMLMADLERTEVAPSSYHLNLGMDASIHYQTPEHFLTGGELVYDSRKRRLRSGVTLDHKWSQVRGTIRGLYDTADHFSDGNGGLQTAGIRTGRIAGRVGVQVSGVHTFSGSGGWLHDHNLTGGDIRQHVGTLRYRYTQGTGFLQEVVATAALQALSDEQDQELQSGSVFVTLLPLHNLRLKIGTDIYRYTADTHPVSKEGHSTVEHGLFVTALQRMNRLLFQGQFRWDPGNGDLGRMALLIWELSSHWQLVSSGGRARSSGGDQRHADIGFRWNGFTNSVVLKAFTRKTGNGGALGMNALVRGSWWWMATYTAVLDPLPSESESSLSTWGRVCATVNGPLDLFTLGTEFYGTLMDTPSWMGVDLWIQARKMGGISLRIGIANLLDGTYAYPYSDFAEAGRSFVIALQYQHNELKGILQ